ncbi:hypothetical protein D3C76_1752720 [compost metagenome]
MNGGERRRHILRQFDIVIPHHGDIIRDTESRLIERLISSHRHRIVTDKDRLRAIFLRQ